MHVLPLIYSLTDSTSQVVHPYTLPRNIYISICLHPPIHMPTLLSHTIAAQKMILITNRKFFLVWIRLDHWPVQTPTTNVWQSWKRYVLKNLILGAVQKNILGPRRRTDRQHGPHPGNQGSEGRQRGPSDAPCKSSKYTRSRRKWCRVRCQHCQCCKDCKRSLQAFGKRHVILYAITLSSEAFGSGKPSFQFDDPIRYSNVDNIDLGATAELYASIPGKFHQYLSSVSSVADEREVSVLRILNHIQAANLSLSTWVQFIKGMNKERSTALHNIRNAASTMFDHEDLPSECFTERQFSRSSIERIRFLLGTTVDGSGEITNPDFPPIVFEDNNPAIARGLFRNDVLFKVVVFHILYFTWTS